MPHETVYNTHLAMLLARQGLDASPEVSQPTGEHIDVSVKVGDVEVAVECKKADPRAALADAEERLEEDLADAAVAVSYPVTNRPEDLTEVDACPAYGEWRPVTIPGLARLIRTVADEAGDTDVILRKFSSGLKKAAGYLDDDQAAGAVRVANIPLPSKEDLLRKPQVKEHPRLRLALLVASAALFQANLDGLSLRKPRIDARDETSYEGGWPPQKLKDCLAEQDVVGALTEAWQRILAYDYRPVFESAVNVLNKLPPGAAALKFARRAARAGLSAANSLGGQHHDLLGRVFHLILQTAAPTGAFYTSAAAATLLAGLSIKPEHAQQFPELTVVDPACGTGTLLVAVANQLRYLNPDAAGDAGGKYLIEDVLSGYDIEAAAIQLAAVALGLMNPRVKFERMGVNRIEYGEAPGGEGVAGSLELYGKTAAVNMLVPMSAQVDTGKEDVVRALRHDVVIMNPPFTRDSLRHDHLGKDAEEAVKAREAEIFKGEPATLRNSAGLFLLLGERLCDEETGTMAMVLPTVSCASPSGKPIWEKLLKTFHLETVVTTHDRHRVFFSENTKISESLFVLRRLNKDNRGAPTKFINLKSNPAKESEALRVVGDINSGTLKGVMWPWERIEAGEWTPVKFLSRYLAETSYQWFAEKELGCVRLGDLAEVGPHGRRTRDAYERGDVGEPDELGRWGLWFNNQDDAAKNAAPAKQTLLAKPDCSLWRKPDMANLADHYWEQSGQLLLPDQFRPGSTRTFAVWLENPVLGSWWSPVRALADANGRVLEEEVKDWEKSTCVYLNSTVGVLAQIWTSSPKVLERPVMPLEGTRNIPIPDLTGSQAARLARVFEDLAERPLKAFRDSDDDAVRVQLDAAVCETLDWDIKKVEEARSALVAEPSVTRPDRN